MNKHYHLTDRTVERFWDWSIPRSSGCWEWVGAIKPNGYGAFTSRDGGSPVALLAHRVAYSIVKGRIPSDKEICHHCDNRTCVNPMHLFLGTHLENMRDMHNKGRWVSPATKLTPQQVSEIRLRYKRGRGVALAKEFGVSSSLISGIVNGKYWKQLDHEYGAM